jgi:HSP20 family molecular chaperone IbpA
MKDMDAADWMWAEACGLIAQAERLHREFFRVGVSHEHKPTWEPPVDVFEIDGELSISVALPGVMAEDIRVLVEGDVLSIAGVRFIPGRGQSAHIHRLEIPHGRFERRLRLPARSMKVVHSLFDSGCLTLVLRTEP